MPSSTETRGKCFELDPSLLWSRKPVEMVKLGVASFAGEQAGA